MTSSEMAAAIGRTGKLTVKEHSGDLVVPIKVTDTRSDYGTHRYQVTPRGGSGKVWVNASRVTLDNV